MPPSDSPAIAMPLPSGTPAKGSARWTRLLRFAGPGLLVAVGYMDPGNWATDIEAGSRFGYGLLCIVLLASLAAMLLQTLCVRLGLVSGMDLAQACRQRYGRRSSIAMWLGAEVAIVACDLAEVLGSALALHLLFGMSVMTGIAITAFDTLLVFALQGAGLRRVEAIVLVLVATITGCFVVELFLAPPQWSAVAAGFVPRLSQLQQPGALYLAIGIVGATVMPHNLYLHSALVRDKAHLASASKRQALRWATADTLLSLTLALLVNAAILTLAAAVFHRNGHQGVNDIEDAYHLIAPVVGSALAAPLFGIALLAAGQSSTFTGTLAGQVVMDGFVGVKLPLWQRRLLTRALALIPAFIGVWLLGDGAVGKLLVLSQVVLSFQLPFAMAPLIRITSDREVMGEHASGVWLKAAAWTLFAAISAANVWLVGSVFAGG